MAQAQNPGKMVQVNLVDRTSIYNSYMSFLNNGGVFIASDDTFAMGDEVVLVLEVGEAADRFPLKTTVCWINPVRGSTTRPRGVRWRKPICNKYGSTMDSKVSASSPILAAIVFKPTGPPL